MVDDLVEYLGLKPELEGVVDDLQVGDWIKLDYYPAPGTYVDRGYFYSDDEANLVIGH